MAKLFKLAPDTQLILALTIFLVAIRITDPWGKGPTRNVLNIIKSLLSRRQKLPLDELDQDKSDQKENASNQLGQDKSDQEE